MLKPLNPMSENKTANLLSRSKVFNLEQLHVRTMPNGGRSRDVLHGKLVTGEVVAIHESNQPAGLPPNPAHSIAHSEFIFIRDGTMEFQFEGKFERVSAGGVVFVAPGTMHTARSVGGGPATYFVVSIGGDTE